MMGKFNALKVFTQACYGNDTGLGDLSRKDLYDTGQKKQEVAISRPRKLYKETSPGWQDPSSAIS